MLPPIKKSDFAVAKGAAGGRKQATATAPANRRTWDVEPDPFPHRKGHPVGTVYDHMEFPKYEYREYPKHVQNKDGKTVVVNTEAEEAEITSGAEEIVREDERKADLLVVAEGRGVKVDRRWSADRIQQTLDDAAAEQVKP